MLHSKQDTKMTVLNILGRIKYLNLSFSCSRDTNMCIHSALMSRLIMWKKHFFQTDPAAVKTILPLSDKMLRLGDVSAIGVLLPNPHLKRHGPFVAFYFY